MITYLIYCPRKLRTPHFTKNQTLDIQFELILSEDPNFTPLEVKVTQLTIDNQGMPVQTTKDYTSSTIINKISEGYNGEITGILLNPGHNSFYVTVAGKESWIGGDSQLHRNVIFLPSRTFAENYFKEIQPSLFPPSPKRFKERKSFKKSAERLMNDMGFIK